MGRGNYRKAFLACRKHRIDLNVIVDRDPKLFRERLPFFVEEVNDVDYINLFLTNLAFVIFSESSDWHSSKFVGKVPNQQRWSLSSATP
jgi:hypothetical protein